MSQVKRVLELIASSGDVEGAHHKQWVLDQVVRILTYCPVVVRTAQDYRGKDYTYEALGESDEYLAWCERYKYDDDGFRTDSKWDQGIAP